MEKKTIKSHCELLIGATVIDVKNSPREGLITNYLDKTMQFVVVWDDAIEGSLMDSDVLKLVDRTDLRDTTKYILAYRQTKINRKKDVK